jgi:uncharacterized protein YjbI with pentapeptide repeats
MRSNLLLESIVHCLNVMLYLIVLDFTVDTMANPTHLRILTQGVNVWNAWRKNRPTISPDLSGADLTYRNLNGANLSNANLNGVDFTHADMVSVNIVGASLEGAMGMN